MTPTFLANVSPDIIENIQDLSLDVPSENCHQAINELLKQTVLVGGKRLRPLLTFLMGDLFDSDKTCLTTCAAAIEMVHAASLSHDDVIDEATTRRSAPSINKVSGNKKAVLAGDYLLAGVINNLAKMGNLELVQEMALIISSLAEGEWLQLDTSLNRNYSREVISEIAYHKTASVMSWCTVAPAYLNQCVDETNREKLISLSRDFGVKLGHAFQLWDDTLDFSKGSQKDQNLDLENDIVNAVVYEWLSLDDRSMELFKKGEGLKDLAPSTQDENLKKALVKVEAEASALLEECRQILVGIARLIPADRKEKLVPLGDIIDYLEARDH